jgi:hypothetical protein
LQGVCEKFHKLSLREGFRRPFSAALQRTGSVENPRATGQELFTNFVSPRSLAIALARRATFRFTAAMKTVKTFSNLAEAGFATSLLEAAGIPALLADEQSSALTPLVGVIGSRVQVADEDYERALHVLAEGPDAVAPSPPHAIEAPARPSNLPLGLFIAIIAGLSLFGIFGRKILKERDAGRTSSAVRTYDYDLNHDGKPDEWATYRGEKIVSVKDDTDFDGKPDLFSRYENGSVVETAVRPGDSPIVVRKWLFRDGVLREEWEGGHADGTFDFKVLIDPFGARSERIPFSSQPKH